MRQGLADIPGIHFPHPTEINFVLVGLPKPVWDGLVAEGYSFSRRGAPAEGIIRIACAWDTPVEAVDALVEAAHRHAGLAPAGGIRGATPEVTGPAGRPRRRRLRPRRAPRRPG